MRESAGLLLYRVRDGRLEVLLAHPGGPLWARRDAGAWSLPKGERDGDEDLLHVARREFTEETGQVPPDGRHLELGTVTLRSGKRIHAWAVEGDLDPATATSTTFELAWPPRSGRLATFPEVDRVAWFTPDEAQRRLNPGQSPLVARLVALLDGAPPRR